jgi:hypothetical protein
MPAIIHSTLNERFAAAGDEPEIPPPHRPDPGTPITPLLPDPGTPITPLLPEEPLTSPLPNVPPPTEPQPT